MVPFELISIFDAHELELLIGGLPEIDFHDLRMNTDYYGYTVNDAVIQQFWAVLKSFSKEEKVLFVQFVTGSSKVRFIERYLPSLSSFYNPLCFLSLPSLPGSFGRIQSIAWCQWNQEIQYPQSLRRRSRSVACRSHLFQSTRLAGISFGGSDERKNTDCYQRRIGRIRISLN
jgi:hypothetical protein